MHNTFPLSPVTPLPQCFAAALLAGCPPAQSKTGLSDNQGAPTGSQSGSAKKPAAPMQPCWLLPGWQQLTLALPHQPPSLASGQPARSQEEPALSKEQAMPPLMQYCSTVSPCRKRAQLQLVCKRVEEEAARGGGGQAPRELRRRRCGCWRAQRCCPVALLPHPLLGL